LIEDKLRYIIRDQLMQRNLEKCKFDHTKSVNSVYNRWDTLFLYHFHGCTNFVYVDKRLLDRVMIGRLNLKMYTHWDTYNNLIDIMECDRWTWPEQHIQEYRRTSQLDRFRDTKSGHLYSRLNIVYNRDHQDSHRCDLEDRFVRNSEHVNRFDANSREDLFERTRE
jgi:hypothetical protein